MTCARSLSYQRSIVCILVIEIAPVNGGCLSLRMTLARPVVLFHEAIGDIIQVLLYEITLWVNAFSLERISVSRFGICKDSLVVKNAG